MKMLKMSLLSTALAATLMASAAHAAAPSPTAAPVVRAQALLASATGKAQGFASAGDAFVATDIPAGAGGIEHVRFNRTYRGLPVVGGDIVVHSRAGKLLSVSKTLRTTARPTSLVPRISVADAIVEAGVAFGRSFSQAPNATLVISTEGGTPKLAYQVRMAGQLKDGRPSDMRYLIDAQTGVKLASWDTVHNAAPGGTFGCPNGISTETTGHSPFMGVVPLTTTKCNDSRYLLMDKSRGGGHTVDLGNAAGLFNAPLVVDTDNAWGTSTGTNRQSDAVAAHYGVAATWDYFKNAHNRVGIAGDGVGVTTRVHYGKDYRNAFWVDGCFCITFGDGMTALDVAGHEMSHGITSRTANLVYRNESGGLNEATSDIFGTMVEFSVNSPANPPDYLIGEEIPSFGGALRVMFKPSLDRVSYECFVPKVANADPHQSSGIGNRFFYLLAEGAVVPDGFGEGTRFNLTPDSLVCNGNTSLAGIGRTDAAKIWYLTLTAYLTSGSTYADARLGSMNAAAELFGIDSKQLRAVAASWDAVSVLSAQ